MSNENHEDDPVTIPIDLTNEVVFISVRPNFVGTYSYIYKGILNGETIAIKSLRAVSKYLSTMQRKLNRERDVWATLGHPNIAPLYGYTEPSELFGPFGSLISPWYNNGDAASFLEEKGKDLPMYERTRLWQGVVSGVCYLHEQNPVIVHGDLKPSNILIDDQGNAKICDFGLVHILIDDGHTGLTTSTPHGGTERYLAPELLTEDDPHPSMSSDIWALGCIGLEFLFLTIPYQNRKNNRSGLVFKDIREGVPPAFRPALVDLAISAIWSILEWCWNFKPNERATSNGVLSIMMQLEVQDRDLIPSFHQEDILRVLTIDADGSCAITQLLILQKFMEVLARKLDVALVGIHPTDFFRLIGGIGYGGYAALLLGRLRLPIQTVIQELTMTALAPSSLDQINRIRMLHRDIEAMLNRHSCASDLPLEDTRCKVVVWDNKNLFRTWQPIHSAYRTTTQEGHPTFVQAACATLTVLPSPATFPYGGRLNMPHLYYDSPLPMIIWQAMDLFPENVCVTLILSLGTNPTNLTRKMVRALAEFNVYVEEDLDNAHTPLMNWTRKDNISAEVNKYFGDQVGRVEALWQSALDTVGTITLGRIYNKLVEKDIISF